MIEYYDLNDESEKIRIEVDLSLIEEAPDVERPWVLWLFVKVSDPLDSNFVPFRDDLIRSLEANMDAVYAGTIAKEGWCELYFYAPSSKKFENITSDVMGQHTHYPYERGSFKDTKWELYQERLYPEPFVLITIQSRHTIEALLEAGDDVSQPREVEHYFFFQTPTALERFSVLMANNGFMVKEKMNDDESDYSYGVTLVKTEPITNEQVEETTSMLYESVLQEHGHYEGWSTVLA